MKSIVVVFAAAHFLTASTLGFATAGGNEEGSGVSLFKTASAPLILADNQVNPEDSGINPKNEDNQYDASGSSSGTGGGASETGGSVSETGGAGSEIGGRGSNTGGIGSGGEDNGNDTGNGSYYISKPAW